MSHFFFSLIRYFPWVALPGALILGGVGVHYRRRKQKLQWSYFAIAGFLLVLSFLWIGFRGDLHMNLWLRTLQGRTI